MQFGNTECSPEMRTAFFNGYGVLSHVIPKIRKIIDKIN